MQTQHVRSLQSANDTKFCVTFSLVTPLFSSLLMNLHDILTRTEVLRFLNSQVLFQLVKNREYRPPSKHAQPYVTIKTIREKPHWGLTSLASTLLDPGRPSGPPYLHSVYNSNHFFFLLVNLKTISFTIWLFSQRESSSNPGAIFFITSDVLWDERLALRFAARCLVCFFDRDFLLKAAKSTWSNRDSLTLQFVCRWGSRDSRANKPVVTHDRQKY